MLLRLCLKGKPYLTNFDRLFDTRALLHAYSAYRLLEEETCLILRPRH